MYNKSLINLFHARCKRLSLTRLIQILLNPNSHSNFPSIPTHFPSRNSSIFVTDYSSMEDDTKGGDRDIEAANGKNNQLYPKMTENPELRWAFIRKVYSILFLQFLLTAIIASIVVFVHPISHYIVSTRGGLAIFIIVILLPFILMAPLRVYRDKHPLNMVLCALFTVSISFMVGFICAFTKGRFILMASILTTVVVVGLALYTFWAVKRGHDFTFLLPFLFASLLVLIVAGAIRIFFPFGSLTSMIFSVVSAIVFCGCIVFDTANLIKRYRYDEYVWAAVGLYMDIINLFTAMLGIMRATES